MNGQDITISATTFNGTLNGNANTLSSCSGNSATATSIASGTAGDLLYQSSANNTAKLVIGANSRIFAIF